MTAMNYRNFTKLARNAAKYKFQHYYFSYNVIVATQYFLYEADDYVANSFCISDHTERRREHFFRGYY